jgi:predicted Rdx family selenoprotein
MDLRRAAVGLQKEAHQKFGTKPKIKTGGFGDFILLVNGTSVFDHKREGALPAMGELLQRIAAGGQRETGAAKS